MLTQDFHLLINSSGGIKMFFWKMFTCVNLLRCSNLIWSWVFFFHFVSHGLFLLLPSVVWYYKIKDKTLQGLRCTHSNSTDVARQWGPCMNPVNGCWASSWRRNRNQWVNCLITSKVSTFDTHAPGFTWDGKCHTYVKTFLMVHFYKMYLKFSLMESWHSIS